MPLDKIIITDTKKQGKYVTKFFYQEAEIYSGLLDIDLTDSQQRYAKKAYAALLEKHPELQNQQSETEISPKAIYEAVRQAVDRFTREEVLPEQKEQNEEDNAIVQQAIKDAEAMANSPDLLSQIADDLKLIGITKHIEAALAAYLVGTSRLLDDPLHMIIQGASSSGKSFIVTTVSSLFPDNETLRYGTLTPTALFHSESAIKHKFLILDERPRQLDKKDIDMTVAYRMLISEKRISRLTTESTPDGKLISRVKVVEGPISSIGTASHDDIAQEDRNRFIIMVLYTPDETANFILARKDAHDMDQSKSLEKLKQQIRYKHHAFQLMLKPYKVYVSPIISQLILMSLNELELHEEKLRVYNLCRNLVATIALLYQYQRRKDPNDEYIKATLRDYDMARPIIDEWLSRVQNLEGMKLPKQALTLYQKISQYCEDNNRTKFYVVQIHECAGGLSIDSIRKYLRQLIKAGLISRNRQADNSAYEYELKVGPSHAFDFFVNPLMRRVTKDNLWKAMKEAKKARKMVREYERTPAYPPPDATYKSIQVESGKNQSPLSVEAVEKRIKLLIKSKSKDENGKADIIPTATEWDEASKKSPEN